MATSADEHAACYFVPTGRNIHMYILCVNAEDLVWTSWDSTNTTRWKHTEEKHIPETPEGQSQRLLPGVQKFKTQEKEELALRGPFHKTFRKSGKT